MTKKSKAQIFLIPTPISESSDFAEIFPETLSILSKCDFLLVENVRTARRFISGLKKAMDKPQPEISQLDLRELDKRTSDQLVYDWCLEIANGKKAAILSEAGCPGVADPGAAAIGFAHELGIEVVPIPGPSSIILSLMGSGFTGQKFKFNGYLPIKDREREREIIKLEKESLKEGMTQIFIETPYRNQKLFNSLLKVCNPNSKVSISTGLLSENQKVLTMSILKWRKEPFNLGKVPSVFLLKA